MKRLHLVFLLIISIGSLGAYADTDISTTENTLYIEGLTVENGNQATLSLKMKNSLTITGFQCKLYLPEGMTVPKDEDDFLMVNLSTSRTSSKKTDIFNAVKQSDGSIMILASSTTSKTFSDNDGEVATITVDVASTIKAGNYTASLKEIVLSDATGTSIEAADVSFTIKVKEAEPVTITAKNYTIKYGDAIPTFEYTAEGAELEGKPEISCSATSTSNVGIYDIVVSKGSISNESVNYVNGTLTIEKAPLTITAKSYSRKQGEDNPSFEAEYAGFKNEETSSVLKKQPIFSCSAIASSAPGDYDIVPSGAEAQNYDISYVNGKLTVTFSPGDINADGAVDISDVVVLVNMVLEQNTDAAGDINGDGTVDISDVVTLVNMILE